VDIPHGGLRPVRPERRWTSFDEPAIACGQFGFAVGLAHKHLPAAAADHYQAALRLTPDFPEAAAALDQILAAHPGLKTREPLDNAH